MNQGRALMKKGPLSTDEGPFFEIEGPKHAAAHTSPASLAGSLGKTLF
jgi:hypothetical protein